MVPNNKTRPRPARRHGQYEKRLSSILKVASRVIARDGFEGASIRNMAAGGKIGLSGIYYYFESKDEILFAIQHHAFSTLVQTLREKLKKATTPEEKLRAVIENHFQFFVENMDDLKVCVHEIESLSGKYYKEVLNIRREYFHLVKEVIKEVAPQKEYEIDLATLFLFGSLNWAYMWFDKKKNADIKKLSSHFLKIFLDGIKRP